VDPMDGGKVNFKTPVNQLRTSCRVLQKKKSGLSTTRTCRVVKIFLPKAPCNNGVLGSGGEFLRLLTPTLPMG
jgi:hypothetical protein